MICSKHTQVNEDDDIQKLLALHCAQSNATNPDMVDTHVATDIADTLWHFDIVKDVNDCKQLNVHNCNIES